MASTAASSFAPLQQWHSRQQQRQQQVAVEASAWWDSKKRVAAAIAGATGKAAPGLAATEQPQAASSSDVSTVWLSGQHDHNPLCPLCRKEQQQQHQCASTTVSSSAKDNTAFSSTTSSTSSSSPPSPCLWPVAYDDPFLWRRLLWRLLGKLSPEAQAFYATHLAMCPHCCSNQ